MSRQELTEDLVKWLCGESPHTAKELVERVNGKPDLEADIYREGQRCYADDLEMSTVVSAAATLTRKLMSA